MNNTLRVIELLEKVISGDYSRIDISKGICFNLGINDCYLYNERDIYLSWKGYSGDCSFPVKPPIKEKASGDYYFECENKYIDTYGKRRIRLAKHIVKCLKKELKQSQGLK